MKTTAKNMAAKSEHVSLNCPRCRGIEEYPPFDYHHEGDKQMRTGHECSKCGYVWDAWWKRKMEYGVFFWGWIRIEKSPPIHQK